MWAEINTGIDGPNCKRVIQEINALATDGFSASVVTDTLQSNFYIFLGSGGDYAKKFPCVIKSCSKQLGAIQCLLCTPPMKFTAEYMYVDIDRANSIEEKHLLREELTQSLGLAKDSNRYPDSIFQAKLDYNNGIFRTLTKI